jgi:hypothetical protein
MSSSQPVPSPPFPEVVEVETVARDYVEGWYLGDAERMDRALHPELVKRTPETDRSGTLREVGKARMVELTAGGGGADPDAVFEILVDDVSTDIATVGVISPEYLDYLHLVKSREGWKIANVLFRVRD